MPATSLAPATVAHPQTDGFWFSVARYAVRLLIERMGGKAARATKPTARPDAFAALVAEIQGETDADRLRELSRAIGRLHTECKRRVWSLDMAGK